MIVSAAEDGFATTALILSADDGRTVLAPDVLFVRASRDRKVRTVMSPDMVALACELVTPETRRLDLTAKPGLYASAGVAALLTGDLTTATWTLLTSPSNGAYTKSNSEPFDKSIPLPGGLALRRTDV